MNREIVSKSELEEFGAERWIMQSTSEEQEMLSRFPDPLPATHHCVYEWHQFGNQRVLRLSVVPKPEGDKPGETVPVGTDDRRKELMKLDMNELKTRAAVASVPLPGKFSKVQLVSWLLEAEKK